MANKYDLIALADMAHYWLGKGKVSNTYECLEQIIEELNKEPDVIKLTTNTTNKTKPNNNTTYTWR